MHRQESLQLEFSLSTAEDALTYRSDVYTVHWIWFSLHNSGYFGWSGGLLYLARVTWHDGRSFEASNTTVTNKCYQELYQLQANINGKTVINHRPTIRHNIHK